MKKLFLGPILAGDKLDIVDQEAVDFPVFFAKFRRSVIANGTDELVDELLRGDIKRRWCPVTGSGYADRWH